MKQNHDADFGGDVARAGAWMVRMLLLAFLILVPAMNGQPSSPPSGLAEAAQAALKKFLPALDSPAMKQTHGFAADDDFSAVTLGEPFEPLYLPPDAIPKYRRGAALDTVLTPSRHWYFSVQSKGRMTCLLSVLHRRDGTLLEDKLGMAQLARIWAAVNEAWPAAKGYTPWLVIVPSHQRFYFTVPQVAPPNLTRFSIEQADTATAKTFEKLTAADTAFAELHETGSPGR